MSKRVIRRKRILVTAIALAAALVFTVSITAYAMTARTVILRDDGEEISFTTIKADAYEILRARGITLEEQDYLDLSEFREDGDCVIRIYRVKKVALIDDGERRQIECAGWVGRLLEETGVALAERDKISFDLYELLEDGMEIEIKRAFDVEVRDFGQDYNLTLTEGVVAQAIELAGLTLEGEDFAAPGLDVPLEPGMTIRVNRVSYRERTDVSAIAFGTVEKKDVEMYLGESRVDQKGVKGELKTTYNDKYINGERVQSTVLQEEVLKEPVDQIRTVGARPAKLQPGLSPISKLSHPGSVKIKDGRPTKYKYAVQGTAKAYSGGTGVASGLGAPKPGYIAVNPKQFPYGTKLWIVTNDGQYIYGYAIAADTGGFVKTKSCMIDVYMPTAAMARQWGVRNVTVYVLDEPRMQTPYSGS